MPTSTKTKPATGVTVERKHLSQGLDQVAPAAAGRGTSLPVLTGVHLQSEPDRLRLTCMDLDVSVTTTVPAVTTGDLDVVVNNRVLRDLVRCAAGPIDLVSQPLATSADEPPVLTVAWGRTVAQLELYSRDEWPRQPQQDGETFTLTAGDLDLVRRMANFASHDDARPILTGLRFSREHPAGVAATDSYRLGVAELEADLPDKPFLLPARVARFLPPRLLDTETATVTLEKDRRYARIAVGEISIRVVLVDGEFPPISRLIPENTPNRWTFNRAELAAAVKTAGVLSIDATPVRLQVDRKAGTVQVLGVHHDLGQLYTTVDATIEGDLEVTCAFNARYLNQLLTTLEGETVSLELTDALKPMVVREGVQTHVLMPVRVS